MSAAWSGMVKLHAQELAACGHYRRTQFPTREQRQEIERDVRQLLGELTQDDVADALKEITRHADALVMQKDARHNV